MIVHSHSDDMGATEHVTQQMLASWRRGDLTGFSVLANGLASEGLAAALSAEPARPARIACHLNLSEGPSAAPAQDVPLLLDKDNNLCHTFGSLIKAWVLDRHRFVEQVHREWRAQIELVQRCIGQRPIAVLDGHMHIHMLPFLFPVAAKLAADYGIPSIRVSLEPFFIASGSDLMSRQYAINAIKHVVLRACSWIAIPVAQRHKLSWPSRIIGILYSGDMTCDRALAGINAVKRAGLSEVEVVFHVGRALESERGRWAGRNFMASFYCSPLRDRESREASNLAQSLRRD